MSERPVEDEIINEARNFGRALMALASQHGRAVSWLEQRRIRKEISRALRQQRQHEYLAHQQQKMWTEQAVDRYRVHAQAVTARSTDPSVDHERRARDQVALRSHAADLQQMVLNGRSLTPVEQGIALDGIDSATAYPGYTRQRSMFAGAGRVKGINALRYRATVARTRAAMPRQVAEVNELRHQIAGHRSTVGRDEPARTPVNAEREAAVQKQVRMQAASPTAATPDTPPAQADRLAAVEKQLKEIAADRDRLSSKVTMLQKGFDSVSAARDEMRSKLNSAEGRISELTNRNQRLAAEIDEVRRTKPGIEELRAERDKFKAERDQAVDQLARKTPPRNRYGSRERVAAEGRGTEQVPFNELEPDIQQALAAEMLTAFENTDSAVIREQRAGLGDDQEALKKFAQWWTDKGLAQYRTEQGQPIYREGPNTTAPTPATPATERTNGRNGNTGIDRSH